MNTRYPTSAELATFRRRTALTNKNAGYHSLALARASHGQTNILRDTSSGDNPFARTYEWEREADATWPMRRYAIDRWRHFNRLTNLLSERDALAEVA